MRPVVAWSAVVFALTLGALPPSAEAALCTGGACVADEPYPDPSPACEGTRWITGAWFASSEVYLYAFGERHDCPGGWGGAGGEGLRVGVFAASSHAEVRWYDAARECEVGASVDGLHAGTPCPVPPPPVPWGDALP